MAVWSESVALPRSGGRTRWRRFSTHRNFVGVIFLLPAAAVLGLFLAYPLGLGFWLSMTDTMIGRAGIFIGLENFAYPWDDSVFWLSVFNTLLYTIVASAGKFVLGLWLALLLNRHLRLKGVYRALIVLPWAVPQIVALAVWRTEFHAEFGMVNQLLGVVGIDGPSWMTEAFWNFAAMIIVNVWLGIPFMMVILLGGLQSIPADLYEAAEIDGASSRQAFRHITLPLIRPVMVPSVILGTVWTFNNFNVPFVINQNELETSDILVTGLFRAAFQYNRYGFAAALAFVIFILLLAFVIVYVRRTGALRGATE